MNDPRSPELLSRNDSRLLIVDVQEKLVRAIPVADRLVANCRKLVLGAQLLSVPVFATEQYPQGLGPTVPELSDLLAAPAGKLEFSGVPALNWGGAAEQADDRHKIVVAGIEAHVCVQQTVLDLLSQGFQVYVPADAVASRQKLDWKISLERMMNSGAVITTTEAVLFEWCEAAGTPEFKEISRLVTGKSPSAHTPGRSTPETSPR